MGQDPSPSGAGVSDTQDPEQIREQIQDTRADLGDTVEALAQKTDVKAQARHRLQETQASVSEKREQLLGKVKEASPDAAVSAATGAGQKARENPLPVAVVGAFALGFLAGWLTKD
jgi:ElaB/YqjD/DUF883 family membrane-anchored ribosome-binding protein